MPLTRRPVPAILPAHMRLRKMGSKRFRRRGKLITKSNHGSRPHRGKRNPRMGRGNG